MQAFELQMANCKIKMSFMVFEAMVWHRRKWLWRRA